MYFSKSLQGSKLAATLRPVSIESTLLLLLLIKNFFDTVKVCRKHSNSRFNIFRYKFQTLQINLAYFKFCKVFFTDKVLII